ncbi:MAG: chitobiase/beta-hexosaminidase C-terminal domain-containing protein, partial [Acidobacteriaceae bacterium]
SSTMYLVSTQSGKLMTGDGLGNLYESDDNGNMFQIAVDNLTAPTSPEQNPITATNITTFLNDGGCTSTPPTVTFTATGTYAAAFTAATTGACTTTATGASFATTLTFSPISVGTNSATLTATDSLSNTGVAFVSGTGTPAPPAATPAFSVAAGTYTTVQTVSISDTSTNASIYYTTDGSTPTSSSTLYTAPITVGVTETLNAIATGNGFATSPVATALYAINLPTAATPTLSVAAGTYTTPQTVSIADTTKSALIYYTTDGSTPTASSTLYAGPITVGSTETINAIAIATNYNNSAIASATYTINLPAAATPAFSVAAGTYTTVQSVSISDTTTGASIYYTLDGSVPTTKSLLYSGAITVPVSTTINAIAVAPPDYNNSAEATAAYVINLPPAAFTITSSSDTVLVSGGTGSVTLTVTANAAFNGTVSFTCSGFMPIGAACAFSPTSVSVAALANGTAKLTVTVPATSAVVSHGSSDTVLAASMLAGLLCFVGLRKRRRLQMLLLFVISLVGLGTFTGCTTTSSSYPNSSQIVINGSGSSLPVDAPAGTQSTQVIGSLPLVLTVQ